MIRVHLVLEEDGTLFKLTVQGHAVSGASGNSVVCAAVSALVRTVVRTVESNTAIHIRCGAPEEGMVSLEILEVSEVGRIWLTGVTDTLRIGLSDLSRDDPAELVVREERRKRNGT